MKLSLKIPLAFACAVLLVFSGAVYGILMLNRAIDTYRNEVQYSAANERMVTATLVEFKLQVQEWKDTLLRGNRPEMLNKYWSAFEKRESKVSAMVTTLQQRLPAGDSKTLITQFADAHRAMGAGYRRGLAAFEAANFDPAAGDRAVAGVDRAPAELLAKASDVIAAQSAAISASADLEARRASELSIGMMLVVVLCSLAGGVVFSGTVSRPLRRALNCAEAVAGGDLSQRVEGRGVDEIAALLKALSRMQQSLASVVKEVRQGATSIAAASTEIAQGNLDLSARTEEQAAALGQTAASIGNITESAHTNGAQARDATDLAARAFATAEQGEQSIERMAATMQDIERQSARVTEITSVIDSIAFQTNILALNAAVEAARAGEHGRGFAVVASEVRGLAQRSAAAAKEIKTLVAQSSQSVATGAGLVDDAGQVIARIVDNVRSVSDIVDRITASSGEQTAGIEQVNQAVAQMDGVTQQNAALVEEASAATQALAEQALALEKLVSVFRVS